MLAGKPRDSMREEEEDLLQFAIQQSLLEAGSEYDQVKGGADAAKLKAAAARGQHDDSTNNVQPRRVGSQWSTDSCLLLENYT